MTVLALGEILLRITQAPHEAWLQSPNAQLRVGGAEANVLLALSQWNHATRLLSALPDHSLGDAVARELRGFGLDLTHVARTAGRLGTYYLDPGALHRPPSVIYDRFDSVFTELEVSQIDWPELFRNVRHFHVSGISAALGAKNLALTLHAMRFARQIGASISFDCNYRQALWQRWNSNAAASMRELMSNCDLLFAEARDIALCFDLEIPAEHTNPHSQFAWTSNEVFKALPNVKTLAHTVRQIDQAEHQSVSSFLSTRNGEMHHTRVCELRGILDRIGTGDAFAAGIIHGYLQQFSNERIVNFAHSAFVLKHGILGDSYRGNEASVLAHASGESLSIKR
jgi:2-dehydro-3-deoxygluconokinase